MYHSKNGFNSVTVPKNYSGNAFKVIDETEKRHIEKISIEEDNISNDFSTKIEEKIEEKDPKNSFLNSFLSDISVEDLLLLGIIFVIHQDNPNDSTLLLLLLLLLAK
ncbi:MAG: hypothetical protein J6S23_05860 [Clostridia bacterium]|nr:hypothetical protein [Clostridia bacterium]